MGDDGVIEIRKKNPISLWSPTWKDSPTSNLDEWGNVINVFSPVAWLLIQGLAVDALRELAGALDRSGNGQENGELGRLLRELAAAARSALLRAFWVDDLQYFSFALDLDRSGRRRRITAVQSDAGWLLDSGVFDDLPEDDRQRYVGGIVRRLFAPDMITVAGVRGRSLAASDPAFVNYHETVWPMDTLKIARGLRRQGFDELAAQLEHRLLNAVNALGSHYEFIPVDAAGRIIDPRHDGTDAHGVRRPPIATEMRPDENLAWSVTGVLRVKRERGCREAGIRMPREPWVEALTAEITAKLEPVSPAMSRTDLDRLRDGFGPFCLSHWRGLLRSAATIIVQTFGRAVPAGLAVETRRRRQR
jgi:glycogen debranching enzyme